MVKFNFQTPGFVRFVRGLLRRRAFRRAFRKCEHLTATTTRRHIVVSLAGKPLVLCKADFKELRRKGLFRREVTWAMLTACRINPENA